MKIVICLMGYQGSGIYKIEQYLIEAYGVKRFRGYTTRRRKFLEDTSEYNFVEVFEMIELEKNSDLIGLRKYNNNLYVKLGNGYFSEEDEKKLREAFNLTCKAQLIAMKISKRV